ncbi:MAG: LysR family transcriptional regulator [Dongiaceae bacterium]
MDALAGMAVFVRIVEAGSFTAAARALGLSKPAVSKQLARLEARLGARLLNRSTRRISLTEAGTLFHQRCLRLLAEAAEAEQAVAELAEAPRGTLRVAAPMSFGQLHLGPAIAAFLARYPDLRIDLALDDRVVDLVGEGYDLAIRIAELPPSRLVGRRLAPNRRFVCAAPAYLAARGTPQHPGELARHDCLHYAYLASGADWRFAGPDGPIGVRVGGRFTANNGDVLRQAALDGLGIAQLPSFLVGDDLRQGRLQPVLCGYPAVDTAIYALYPPTRQLPRKVRAFVDFLVDRFAAAPWDVGLPGILDVAAVTGG